MTRPLVTFIAVSAATVALLTSCQTEPTHAAQNTSGEIAPPSDDEGTGPEPPVVEGCLPAVCGMDPSGKPCPACSQLPEAYGTSCVLDGEPDPPTSMKTTPAFGDLSFSHPVQVTHAGDGSNRLFVVEKKGRIRAFPNTPGVTSGQVTVFLDITDRVDGGPNEAGLLSVAFHPKYAQNGQLFVNYTGTKAGKLTTFISRFTVSSGDSDKADATSESKLMDFTQPYGNHNGGQIAFGPDGFLYIGNGDGGAANDPLGAGQDRQTRLGKILRIGVDGQTGQLAYEIPADNPFATNPAQGLPEIYAWGVRNPWRFSFDRLTGQLWAADVGQNKWEYVHIIEKGKNYGWNIVEGSHCFNPAVGCNKDGLEMPVVEYDHSAGKSITGGFVYRGKKHPSLVGAYVYGDYSSRKIWAVRYEADKAPVVTPLVSSTLTISSFGEDEAGELYVVDYPYFNPNSGSIHTLAPHTAAAPRASFPLTLSATGCFTDVAKMTPAKGLLPYEVNASLWHDGAGSERYLILPQGKKMKATPEGVWELPAGTKLIKTFLYPQTGGTPVRLETRFVVTVSPNVVKTYTYRWNEEQSDAFLLNGAAERTFTADGKPVTWHFPSRSQCQTCHNEAAGGVLGLHTGQLNRDGQAGSVTGNQLTLWAQMGIVEQLPATPAKYPDPHDASADLEKRARAALFVNCANCHLPNGPVTTPLDLRYETALGQTKACDVSPEKGDMGVAGAKLIAPGKAGSSTLYLRMKSTKADRMPNLGSFVVDQQTVSLVEQWIDGLSGCQ